MRGLGSPEDLAHSLAAQQRQLVEQKLRAWLGSDAGGLAGGWGEGIGFFKGIFRFRGFGVFWCF